LTARTMFATNEKHILMVLITVTNLSGIIFKCYPSHFTTELSQSSTLDEDVVSNTAPGRPQPRIARADVVGHRTDGRVLQQYTLTEIVSALAFLPQYTHLLLAGISARWLRLFDFRTPTPTTTNIATSPIDPHQIPRLPHPLLTFTEKYAAVDGARTRGGSGGGGGGGGAGGANSNAAGFVDHIEFSSSRRGVLAKHEKDTSYVRFRDLQQVQGSEDFADGERFGFGAGFGFGESLQLSGATSKRSWAPWTAAGSGMKPSNVESQETMALILSDTRKMVNKDADFELYAIHDTPKQASWSARGDLAIGTGPGCKVLPGFEDRGVPPQPWDVHAEEETTTRGRGKTVRQPMFGKGDEDGFPQLGSNASPSKVMKARTYSPASFRLYPLEHSVVRTGDEPKPKGRGQLAEKNSSRVMHSTQSVSQVVEDDISMMMRRRAIPWIWTSKLLMRDVSPCRRSIMLKSYRKILAQIQHSQSYGLGYIIPANLYASRRQDYTDMSSQTKGFLDYGKDSRRCLKFLTRAHRLSASLTPFSAIHPSVVVDPLTRMRQPSDDFVYGDFAALPLYVRDGQVQNAHVKLLRDAQSYVRAGGTPSSELRDYTECVIFRLRGPCFRVVLTQLASKDWSEVLEEELLPLRERLAIAFQFLEDEALSSYLRRTTDRACTRDDIEGLIIAGLTPTGMVILQDYVDRTGDVQTAAILGAYASPAKFADGRAEQWLEMYRDLLDRFKLFHHRVAFDIERGQTLQDAVQNGDLAPFE
ncbi:hypothetical protein K503DRAFT_787848, partial [Rhizopogon vinicolor AM-OR11-026]